MVLTVLNSFLLWLLLYIRILDITDKSLVLVRNHLLAKPQKGLYPTQSPCPMQHFLTWRELLRLLPELAKAARMAVVVVPMLAPSVSGYALSMLITPIPGGKIQSP